MSAEKTRKKSGVARLYKTVAFALVVAAVTKELQKDPQDRTWHGTVAGFVPYEFRMPTVERVKSRVWDPDNAHILSPHVFGVGWTVNVGRVVAVAKNVVDG
ncbi:DUF5808 domain-containing protein [Paraoerskovia marina]|uniref:DUF5808 domain-containing protein n=1 Tax=Paraoerskovia marina TaxID=545619 RepID=A0A1H1MJU4_9CELL|nr:DUF5808 domain-containing protein [Paraoerskovia marina]SDR86890.1 hypothetical protein SAMN04489860_0258 [Paraoerskovia marina]